MAFCGRTRREFLWQTGAGFTGLALSGLLQEDGFFARVRAAEAAAGSPEIEADPLAVKLPHFARGPSRSSSCSCTAAHRTWTCSTPSPS